MIMYLNEVNNLKNYLVFLFQLMVWSSYTLAEWLSVYDRLVFKCMMFFLFSYLAIYIGKIILKSTKQTLVVTTVSLICYAALQLLLMTIMPV